MRPVRLICASNDLERARTIEQLLGMEGFDVQITTRRLSGASEEDEDEECGVVLWSRNSIDSWPVLELAEDLHRRRSLVQVALEQVTSAIPSYSGPIDFKGWSGERDSAWSLLRTRIDLIENGGEQSGAPLGAVATLGLASLSILSIAVSDRVGEGPAPPIQVADAGTLGAAAPAPIELVGGPNVPEPEWDLAVAVPEMSVPLRTHLPPLPDLATLRPVPRLKISRPSLLRSLLNRVEQIASLGDDDERAES
jgi:hypothetical protein